MSCCSPRRNSSGPFRPSSFSSPNDKSTFTRPIIALFAGAMCSALFFCSSPGPKKPSRPNKSRRSRSPVRTGTTATARRRPTASMRGKGPCELLSAWARASFQIEPPVALGSFYWLLLNPPPPPKRKKQYPQQTDSCKAPPPPKKKTKNRNKQQQYTLNKQTAVRWMGSQKEAVEKKREKTDACLEKHPDVSNAPSFGP